MLAVYDPRARYLTGLGAPDPRRMPFHPSAAYAAAGFRPAAMMSRRRRMAFLAAYDPRVRYLTGLGQDPTTLDTTVGGVVPYLPPPIPPQSDQGPILVYGPSSPAAPPVIDGGGGGTIPIYTVNLPLPPGTVPAAPGQPVVVAGGRTMPAVAGQAVPAPGYAVNAQGQVVPTSATSWWSGTTLGISNSMLTIGLSGIGLLAMLSSGRRR